MGRVEDTIMIPQEMRPAVRAVLDGIADRVQERDEPHCEYVYVFAAQDGRLIVRQYDNGRLHMQGSAEDLYRKLLAEVRRIVDSEKGALSSVVSSFPHGGSDEAGKGDVFGPLVVSAVYVRREEVELLLETGVSDSKTLTDRRSRELAMQIKAYLEDGRWVTEALLPVQYNDLYRQYRGRHENLNDLLAASHARCIRKLVSGLDCAHEDACPVVLVDKFAREELLVRRMDTCRVNLVQLERGERDPAVAAASILARDEFLRALDWLGDVFGHELPKGAGAETVRVGRKLVDRYGSSIMEVVAKTHFSNVREMCDR